MSQGSQYPNHKSIRISEHEYDNGWFSITLCVQGKKPLLGTLIGEQVQLSPMGEFVETLWKKLPERWVGVLLDVHVIMPDHMHAILFFDKDIRTAQGLPPETLFEVMRQFKAASARLIHKTLEGKVKEFKWQDRYYDHIIRSEQQLQTQRRYILENPIRRAHQLARP